MHTEELVQRSMPLCINGTTFIVSKKTFVAFKLYITCHLTNVKDVISLQKRELC